MTKSTQKTQAADDLTWNEADRADQETFATRRAQIAQEHEGREPLEADFARLLAEDRGDL